MKEITYTQMQSWISKKEDFALIDVREEWEHDRFNIGGQLLPLGEIMQRKKEIPKQGKIVVYCKGGVRSLIAIQRLTAHFPNVLFYNLKGGVSQVNL